MRFVTVYFRSRNNRLKVLGGLPTKILKFSSEVGLRREEECHVLKNVTGRSIDDRHIELYMVV